MPGSEVHNTKCLFSFDAVLWKKAAINEQEESGNGLKGPKRGRDKTKRSRPCRLSFSPKRKAAGKRDDRQMKQNGMRKASQGEEK